MSQPQSFPQAINKINLKLAHVRFGPYSAGLSPTVRLTSLLFPLPSPLCFPSITLCQLKFLKEGAEREAERGEQRFGPSTKEWDLIPRRSKKETVMERKGGQEEKDTEGEESRAGELEEELPKGKTRW